MLLICFLSYQGTKIPPYLAIIVAIFGVGFNYAKHTCSSAFVIIANWLVWLIADILDTLKKNDKMFATILKFLCCFVLTMAWVPGGLSVLCLLLGIYIHNGKYKRYSCLAMLIPVWLLANMFEFAW
jgi:hypothetical protein